MQTSTLPMIILVSIVFCQHNYCPFYQITAKLPDFVLKAIDIYSQTVYNKNVQCNCI